MIRERVRGNGKWKLIGYKEINIIGKWGQTWDARGPGVRGKSRGKNVRVQEDFSCK